MCDREGYRNHRHGDDCGCGREEEGQGQECACGSGHQEHHRHHQDDGQCGCGCHGGHGEPERSFQRRFATREERIARLQAYLQDLHAEAQAVEEHIQAMKAAQ